MDGNASRPILTRSLDVAHQHGSFSLQLASHLPTRRRTDPARFALVCRWTNSQLADLKHDRFWRRYYFALVCLSTAIDLAWSAFVFCSNSSAGRMEIRPGPRSSIQRRRTSASGNSSASSRTTPVSSYFFAARLSIQSLNCLARRGLNSARNSISSTAFATCGALSADKLDLA